MSKWEENVRKVTPLYTGRTAEPAGHDQTEHQ